MNVTNIIKPLLTAHLPYLHLERLEQCEDGLVAVLNSQQPTSNCPKCGKPSQHIHSHYQRCLQDLPISGQAVCWMVQARRFRCATKRCKQRIFCERFVEQVKVYSRNTLRNNKILEQTALLFGAKPSTKLTVQLGFQTSAATLLRRAHQNVIPSCTGKLKAIGVDDFALKKGRVYGTIIVNHENHRVVDLLPDRSSETLEVWLKQHPEIDVITRDRSLEYNKACTGGAPKAQQVLDKWHVLHNLRKTLQGLLERYTKQIADLAKKFRATINLPLYKRSAKEQEAAQRALEVRQERLLLIRDLHGQGKTIVQIAHELPASRTFVAKAIASNELPELRRNPHGRSVLNPWLRCLEDKFQAGLRNARQFWRELQSQGFTGSYERVHDWVRFRRDQELHLKSNTQTASDTNLELANAKVVPDIAFQLEKTRGFSARQLAFLLLLPLNKLSTDDHKVLTALQTTIPDVIKARELVTNFKTLIDSRDAKQLETWFGQMKASGLPDLVSFAKALEREQKPLKAMITTCYSNGRSEGHVNRLKMIKRQGYGRAGFDLLRKRVLLS
jgi:transposase